MEKGKGLLITGVLGILLLAFGWYKLSPKNKSSEATEDTGTSSGGGGGSSGSSTQGTTTKPETPSIISNPPPRPILISIPMPTPTKTKPLGIVPVIKTELIKPKPIATTNTNITGKDTDDDYLMSINQTL